MGRSTVSIEIPRSTLPPVSQDQSALPSVQAVWADRRQEAGAEWGGVIAMNTDGAVLGLRP